MKRIAAAGAVFLLAGPAFSAGMIETACQTSERPATAVLCQCIQNVANVQLTGSDQVLAAKFFTDPDLAQETRQSNDARKESFWLRYKAFGALAARTCG
jgi:hypothetical protein